MAKEELSIREALNENWNALSQADKVKSFMVLTMAVVGAGAGGCYVAKQPETWTGSETPGQINLSPYTKISTGVVTGGFLFGGVAAGLLFYKATKEMLGFAEKPAAVVKHDQPEWPPQRFDI